MVHNLKVTDAHYLSYHISHYMVICLFVLPKNDDCMMISFLFSRPTSILSNSISLHFCLNHRSYNKWISFLLILTWYSLMFQSLICDILWVFCLISIHLDKILVLLHLKSLLLKVLYLILLFNPYLERISVGFRNSYARLIIRRSVIYVH